MSNLSVPNLPINPVTGKADSWGQVFPPPVGYFVPAKMPLHLVHPRPDSETNVYARHRKYHSQMIYQVPMGWQGGAWPFKYEIVDAPAGTTIGQFYGTANYGVLSWNPIGQTGTQSFSVRVTDASGNQSIAIWSADLDDDAFIFLQDGYAGAKLGTIDQPLEDIPDWYKNSNSDATYHNKIIVFRGGNYLATGNAAASPANMQLNLNYKTGMLIGFPGEKPVIDCQYAKIDDISGRDDIFISGITFKNARNDLSNAQFFVIGGYCDRVTFWNCEFREMSYGQIGNDNATPIFCSSPGIGSREYLMLKQCVFDQINTHSAGNNGSYIDVYRTTYLLIEENLAKNSHVSYGFWDKASIAYTTIRGNVAVENVNGAQFSVANGAESGVVPHHKEMCWNISKVPATSPALLFNYSGNTMWNGQGVEFFCYRNTGIGQAVGIFQCSETPVYTDGNLFAVNNTVNLSLNSTGAVAEDIVVAAHSPIVNEFGRLTGAVGFGKNGGELY